MRKIYKLPERKKNILQKNKNQIGIRLFIFKNLENNEIMKHCLLSSKRKGFCICNSFIYNINQAGGKKRHYSCKNFNTINKFSFHKNFP